MTPLDVADEICRLHKHELGYVMRKSLERAAGRGELYVEGAYAMAYVWHRRDGQTTIHAIAITLLHRGYGHGAALLARIASDARARGQRALVAKCPLDLPSNGFYARIGFTLLRVETGRKRALNVWALDL